MLLPTLTANSIPSIDIGFPQSTLEALSMLLRPFLATCFTKNPTKTPTFYIVSSGIFPALSKEATKPLTQTWSKYTQFSFSFPPLNFFEIFLNFMYKTFQLGQWSLVYAPSVATLSKQNSNSLYRLALRLDYKCSSTNTITFNTANVDFN